MKNVIENTPIDFKPFVLNITIQFETSGELKHWKESFKSALHQCEDEGGFINLNRPILHRKNGDGMSCLNKLFMDINSYLS